MAYFLSTYFPGVFVREEVSDAWEALSMFAAQKTALTGYFEEGFLPLATFRRDYEAVRIKRHKDPEIGIDPSVAGLPDFVPDGKIIPVLQQLLLDSP